MCQCGKGDPGYNHKCLPLFLSGLHSLLNICNPTRYKIKQFLNVILACSSTYNLKAFTEECYIKL